MKRRSDPGLSRRAVIEGEKRSRAELGGRPIAGKKWKKEVPGQKKELAREKGERPERRREGWGKG